MIRLFTISFFLMSLCNAFAALNGNISGVVKDNTGAPVPYANVILVTHPDSSIVKAVLTDESGSYRFDEIVNGSFRVMIAQLGFEKYYSESFEISDQSSNISLKEIKLSGSTVTLQEASVTAMRPFIEHRIDRTVVNVENSIVNAGASALEILQKSPGITIDSDGNIILAGKQGVLVMIDGKPTYLSRRDLYELLRNTNSDQLSQIDIITNPSAKYDAAGTSGLIDIKMKKKQNTGFNGRVQVSFGQGVYPDAGTGFNLNYGNSKINLFAGYDYFNGLYFEKINLTRRFTEPSFVSTFRQHTFDKGNFINQSFRTGADYFYDKKNTFGIIIKGNRYGNTDNTVATTDVYNGLSIADSGYVTYNHSESRWSNISGNLNYRLQIDTTGQEFTADLDYAHYSNFNNFEFTTDHYFTGNDYKYFDLATSDQPAKINIRSFKADYVLPFNKNFRIETGGKTSYVSTDNDVQYYNYFSDVAVLDHTKTNHFKYSENINALYFNYSAELNKFGIQAGLRTEQTISKGEQIADNSAFKREYIQFFPSTFLSYKFNDKHRLKASYSRRIDRPEYQQLNPFKYFIDPYNYMEGNPLLEPQLTNSYELSYTFMQMFIFALKYSHTSDAMTQITKQIDSTRTTFVTTENLDAYDNYGINLSIPVKITEWFQSSNNINVFNNRYKGFSSVGLVDKNLTSYTFNSNNSLTLPKGINAEINFWYNSRMVWGTWLVKPQYNLSIGLSRMFLKERIQVRVNVNDIFHTEITESKISHQNIDADFKRVYDSQFVRIHVSYKFGKQMQRNRMRHSGSEDEQNRVRQGR